MVSGALFGDTDLLGETSPTALEIYFGGATATSLLTIYG